jgi:hypothetical protein
VVVFNLTRFARDKYDHFALRSLLQALGISLRSATEPIDDTSTGKLMEGVLAAFAQFDNDVRADRTRAGMKAALELGRWPFLAPLGYLNAPRGIGKSLVPDSERAPIVWRVFEEYATGRFTKQQVLEQARAWGLTNRRNRPLTSQAIGVLLRNPLYAGIVDVPAYGVRAKRGDFEPLISEELFYRVQSVRCSESGCEWRAQASLDAEIRVHVLDNPKAKNSAESIIRHEARHVDYALGVVKSRVKAAEALESRRFSSKFMCVVACAGWVLGTYSAFIFDPTHNK